MLRVAKSAYCAKAKGESNTVMEVCSISWERTQAHTRVRRRRRRRRLKVYDGRDKWRPILLALKGRVLNVTKGEEYYGPGAPYKNMAGKDARYARRPPALHVALVRSPACTRATPAAT